MEIESKEDFSMYYFLVNLFSSTPFINVRDGFPVENLVIPTVSVDSDSISPYNFEQGNRKRVSSRIWFIDVFAVNKGQRDELTYQIMRALESPIPVYDYSVGFPPAVAPQIGSIDIDEVNVKIVKIFPELVDKLYYRANIEVTAHNTIL